MLIFDIQRKDPEYNIKINREISLKEFLAPVKFSRNDVSKHLGALQEECDKLLKKSSDYELHSIIYYDKERKFYSTLIKRQLLSDEVDKQWYLY